MGQMIAFILRVLPIHGRFCNIRAPGFASSPIGAEALMPQIRFRLVRRFVLNLSDDRDSDPRFLKGEDEIVSYLS